MVVQRQCPYSTTGIASAQLVTSTRRFMLQSRERCYGSAVCKPPEVVLVVQCSLLQGKCSHFYSAEPPKPSRRPLSLPGSSTARNSAFALGCNEIPGRGLHDLQA